LRNYAFKINEILIAITQYLHKKNLLETFKMKYLRISALITVLALVLILSTSVFAGWTTFIVDDGGEDDVGQSTSQEIVNLQPAVSYIDETNDNLKYVRANNAANKDWGSPVTVDTTNVRGESDLFLVDGNPAIAYFDTNQNHLKFVRAKDANGTNWNTPVPVDDSGIAGWNLGAGIVDGNPAICYLDKDNFYLIYVRATNAQGTSWGSPQIVDKSADTGYECSIAIVDGNPAIGYWEYDGDDVMFVRALDSIGATWGTPQIVDAADGSSYQSELRIVNGNPALAYHDSTNDRLKFVRATNSQGSSWGTPEILDSSGKDVGLFASLAIVDGVPAVSYAVNNSGNPHLSYVNAVDSSGISWNDPELVGVDHTGWWNSLVDFNGQAAISSYDAPNTALRFALLDPAVDHTIYLPIVLNK